MGSLGENPVDGLNGIVYRFLPYAYRVWRASSELYDGMNFVTEAHAEHCREEITTWLSG